MDTTITEELNRKAVETLDDLMTRFERGSISPAQASTGLSSIFGAIGGLVSGDVFNLVSEASQAINENMKQDVATRQFISKSLKELVILRYQFGEAFLCVSKVKLAHPISESVTRAGFETEVDPFEAARLRYNSYASALIRQGYTEIK